MAFFIGGDVGLVFHGGADVVEALEEDFFARRRNFKFVNQAVAVADSLIGKIDGKGIAFFFFGALEEFFDLLLGEFGGQNSVLEAVVVEDVGVTGSEDYAESVIADGPRGVFAAGAATEIRARQ